MLVTGNEYISLPSIDEKTGAIKDLTLLYMGVKGLLDLRSNNDLFSLEMFENGQSENRPVESVTMPYTLVSNWIPECHLRQAVSTITVRIFAPIGHRGFVYQVQVENTSSETRKFSLRLTGNWASLWHCVNEEKRFDGTLNVSKTSWGDGPVFDATNGFPVFSFSALTDTPCIWEYSRPGNEIGNDIPDKGKPCKNDKSDVNRPDNHLAGDHGIDWASTVEVTVEGHAKASVSWYWGFGYEEVAAVTSAREMQRWGTVTLLKQTVSYLDSCHIPAPDPKLERTLNRNLLFCLFFATGKTLDTEEQVIVTSRSPRYYVSAAYWDRDSLLWAFPAIVQADRNVAREIIGYIADRQWRNVGVHSRYIDGTVLEPGFELDELCAPIIALDHYIQTTDEHEILTEATIRRLIDHIITQLEKHLNTDLGLYDTFLQPTDDMRVYPYLTYDNVLVWKVFKILAAWKYQRRTGTGNWTEQARELETAINGHCVKTHEGRRQYVWSVDGQGRYDIYDEPPGSLLLLPFYGFCSMDDEVYRNTVAQIKAPSYGFAFSGYPFGAIGCPHAPHPWVLSLANETLVFHDESAVQKLITAPMDNDIACESIDEHTGICTTGEAFATCAGFVAYALIQEVNHHAG